ncbi:MAG: hypothetical protein ABMB14_09115, partial [Myxococcota bacterium]
MPIGRWIGWAARWLGLWVAYTVLFGAGGAWFAPDVGQLSAADADRSAWMLAVIAAIDVALVGGWISRSTDRGLRLWLQAFVVTYGIKTFSSTLEVWWFVGPSHVPPDALPGLFAMTLPLAIGWTGLA